MREHAICPRNLAQLQWIAGAQAELRSSPCQALRVSSWIQQFVPDASGKVTIFALDTRLRRSAPCLTRSGPLLVVAVDVSGMWETFEDI